MIKIRRDAAERLLLAVSWIKNRDYGCYGVLEEGLKLKGWKQQTTLRNIYNEGIPRGGRFTKWGDFIDHLVEQLDGVSEQTKHHPTLIDMIVEVLQSPYARNVLAGRTLTQLKRAVMLPEDMIKVGEAIRKEMFCAGCGKAFQNREMCSANANDEGGGMAFYCTRCVCPSYAACDLGGCDNSKELNQSLIGKVIGKSNCGEHDSKQTAKSKPASAPIEGLWDGGPILPDPGPAPPQPAAPPDAPLGVRVVWNVLGREQAPHHIAPAPERDPNNPFGQRFRNPHARDPFLPPIGGEEDPR